MFNFYKLQLRPVVVVIVCIAFPISSASLISYPESSGFFPCNLPPDDTAHLQCLGYVLRLAHWHVPENLVHSRQFICLECFLQVLGKLAEEVPTFLLRRTRFFDVRDYGKRWILIQNGFKILTPISTFERRWSAKQERGVGNRSMRPSRMEFSPGGPSGTLNEMTVSGSLASS